MPDPAVQAVGLGPALDASEEVLGLARRGQEDTTLGGPRLFDDRYTIPARGLQDPGSIAGRGAQKALNAGAGVGYALLPERAARGRVEQCTDQPIFGDINKRYRF